MGSTALVQIKNRIDSGRTEKLAQIKQWVEKEAISIDDLRRLTGDMYEQEQRADAMTGGIENVF